MNEIYRRLFVVASSDGAQDVATRLCAHLCSTAEHPRVNVVRPYWKFEGQQEVYMCLGAFEAPAKEIASFAGELGTGWSWLNEREAVWNAGEGSAFVEPSVRWAHLEVIPRSGKKSRSSTPSP